jgi:hypothetical protein
VLISLALNQQWLVRYHGGAVNASRGCRQTVLVALGHLATLPRWVCGHIGTEGFLFVPNVVLFLPMEWENELRARLGDHRPSRQDQNGLPVSIKVRVMGGCFHRQHSPVAYELIDQFVRSRRHDEYEFVEHESGPELLVFLAVGTAALTFGKSVVDLITTIIKARSEGQKKGDRPREDLQLIVRGFDRNGTMFDEVVLKIGPGEKPSANEIEAALMGGAQKYLRPVIPIKRPAKRKKRSR